MSRVFFASQSRRKLTIATLCAAVLAVSGCETIGGTKTADTSLKANPTATEQLAAVQEVFNANAEQVPTLTAVGYAVVSSQPGRSDAQKRLMAIRSARMAAMRDLAEQIHGLLPLAPFPRLADLQCEYFDILLCPSTQAIVASCSDSTK